MTAPRTWDVTLRFTVPDDCAHPKVWGWGPQDIQRPVWWLEATVEYIDATEVKVWHFGDIITEDDKPDVPFNAVNPVGHLGHETSGLSSAYGPWRLIWLDGQELA